jgi:hypothetical protein
MGGEEIRKAQVLCSSAGIVAKGRKILRESFDREDGKNHGVGVVDVEHETSNQCEKEPLLERARSTRLVPIPEEKRHGKGRMRVRPGGIEIHVDGERTGSPYGKSSEERPAFLDVVASQAKSKEQTEKSINGCGESHGDAVRGGETVSRDSRTKAAREKDSGVSQKKKRGPEDGRANREVIVKMACGRPEASFGLTRFVETRASEAFVGMPIVFGEIEIVLDEQSTSKSVIADTVAAHPGIEERKRE